MSNIHHPTTFSNYGIMTSGDLLTAIMSGKLKARTPYLVGKEVTNIPTPNKPCLIFYIKSDELSIDYYVLARFTDSAGEAVNYYDKVWSGWMFEDAGGGSSTKPDEAGWVMPPEVKTYDGVNSFFDLKYAPKFEINVYILKPDDSFYMLQAGDYSISGTRITISNPTLVEGDRMKIIYAI